MILSFDVSACPQAETVVIGTNKMVFQSLSRMIVWLLFCVSFFSCRPQEEKKLEPTFSSISEVILAPKCALYTCHSPAYYQQSGNLDLSDKNAYYGLVNVKSILFPDEFRIKPGDPDNSNMIKRLEGTILAGIPLERSSISKEEIKVIRQWIKDGALLN